MQTVINSIFSLWFAFLRLRAAHLALSAVSLLCALVSEGFEGWNLLRVDEALEDCPDARLIVDLCTQS